MCKIIIEPGLFALCIFTRWHDATRKFRKGKAVTIIADFIGSTDDLKELGKTLKIKCAVGGNVKDGIVILQGDVREKAVKILTNLGYNVKKSGS